MQIPANIDIFVSVSSEDKLLFTRHLGVMLKSGIPIAEAIQVIEDQSKNNYFKKVLRKIRDDLTNGQTLHSALDRFPKIFDPIYVNLIRLGEESGNLETNLEFQAIQLKKDFDFRQKVVGASLYPLIILLTALIVGGGVSFFVLPKLIDLFQSLDTNLPLATRILLWAATTMRDYGIVVFGIIITLFIVLRLLLRIHKVRYVWQVCILSFPLIGEFVQNVELTTFSRNIGLMLKSGLSIDLAFESQAKATTNLVYQSYCQSLYHAIQKGGNIGKILAEKRYRFVPMIVSKMVEVGERSGSLEQSFLYLGDFFEDEVDNTVKNLSNILEPILLLFIGLVVAFVAMAIISPIYQFTGAIKR